MTADLNLEIWLERVTAPFPSDTAWRLRTELTAHHAEAVHALTLLRASNPQLQALRDLGDPAVVVSALGYTHFTQADVAWMERDPKLVRLLANPEALERGPDWRWATDVLLWLALAIYCLFGFPGRPSVLSMYTTFSPLAYVLLGLTVTLATAQRLTVQARPQRSAAVLKRCWGILRRLLGSALLLLVLIGPHPVLGLAFLLLLLQTYLLRPREALSLLPKAWRGAQ